MVDLPNGRIIAPTTGYYQVAGEIMFGPLGSAVQSMLTAIIAVNSVEHTVGTRNPYVDVQAYSAAVVSGTIHLNQGDYVELWYSASDQTWPLYIGTAGHYNYLSLVQVAAGPGPKGDPGPAGAPGAPGAPGDSVTVPLEPWHTIGGSGEPVFENGWSPVPGETPPGFRKFPDGTVKLRGQMRLGTIAVTAWTLPPGYRPPIARVRNVIMDTSGGGAAAGVGQVNVGTDGTIIPYTIGNNDGMTVSLDQVDFDTASVTEWAVGPKGDKGDPGASVFTSTQRMVGAYGGYAALPVGDVTNGAGQVMALSITPSVPMWWEVNGDMGLVQKMDAVYNYGLFSVALAPADQDGVSSAMHYISQHSAVQLYMGYTAHRLFRLAAGQAYTVKLTFGADGGSWQYYPDAARLSLVAKAWPQ
jgi:hypothetical protein